jgi:ADP-heptose:LPS heptosyltransferase
MTAFWWNAEARRKVCAGSYLETAHDLVGAPYEFGPLFFSSEEEKYNAMNTKKKIGDRFILWVLSGTRVDKIYSYATFAVARIVRELRAPVVLMGGPSDKEIFMGDVIKDFVALQNGSREGLHLAIPEKSGEQNWPLRTSLSLALTADLVITPDTGTAWAVAMEQMPKIMLLSHASAENVTKHWVNTVTMHADQERVPCWPCHRLHDDNSTCVPNKENNGAACISDISVDKLVEAAAKCWDGRNVVPFRREQKVRGVAGMDINQGQA